MVKISGLPKDSAPTTTDYIVVVDSETGQSKKVLLSDLFGQANIPYAALLTTIFSGQVQSHTPTISSTTGGSWSGASAKYINLGGIKILWGRITMNATATQGRATVTLPSGFFTTVQLAIPAIESEGNSAFQTASGDSVLGSPPSTFGFYVNNTANGSSCTLTYLLIGT